MPDVRLIDANAADVERICCYYGGNCDIEDVKEWLDEQPTIDAVPVVHARWEIIHGMINPKYTDRKRCSRCGDISPSDMCCREMLTNYCPNCGAKMGGGAK